MTREEKVKKIAHKYGYDAQSRQLVEECAELIQSVNKFWRKELVEVPIGTPCEKNIIEELADVKIMIYQIEIFLNAVGLLKRKLKKNWIDR